MKQYSCPVHKTKSATDYDFNEAVKLCIENINKVAICVGTHNENSLLFLADQMKKNKIQKNHNRVFISQLLGMSDHISYNASQKGYNVAKYVPYGPVKELVPYLIRRANENKSISGQVNRELENLKQEIYRRRKHN